MTSQQRSPMINIDRDSGVPGDKVARGLTSPRHLFDLSRDGFPTDRSAALAEHRLCE